MTLDFNWPATQSALSLTPDGDPGDATYSAILRLVADRAAKPENILAMARALKRFAVSLGGLSNPARLKSYVANTANETGGFVKFEEGLSYSAERMAEVWPGRYQGKDGKPNSLALSLARNPVAFANATYGDRMGNEINGTADNDGYDFRGLGPMQNTGRANAIACERDTGIPFSTQPGLMIHPGIGTLAALSWWRRSGCNAWCDKGNSKAARSIANAGRPDLANPEGWPRVSQYEAILAKVLP